MLALEMVSVSVLEMVPVSVLEMADLKERRTGFLLG